MNHQIIKQIIEEVFEKVKSISASHKKNALSNKIELQSKPRISYKTAERAYEKYIDQLKIEWSPNRISVNNFCKFLGYEDYEDYVNQNYQQKPIQEEKSKTLINDALDKGKVIKQKLKSRDEERQIQKELIEEEENGKPKWTLLIKVLLTLGAFSILYLVIPYNINNNNESKIIDNECMVWVKNQYVKVDCNLDTHPEYGTKVEPLNLERMLAMKKVEVTASTPFFSEETGKPLIWYYKNKNKTLEYFTSSGLHPVNQETLKKITKHIIATYVPIHSNNTNSFIKNEEIVEATNSKSINVGIAVFDSEGFNQKISSKILDVYFNKSSSNIYLKNELILTKENIESKLNLKDYRPSFKMDTLCLGIANYEFIKSKTSSDRIICVLKLKFDIYKSEKVEWKKIRDEFIEHTGTGYSKNEALTNTIKKIYYE